MSSFETDPDRADTAPAETMIGLIDSFRGDESTALVHNGDSTSYADFYADIAGLAANLADRIDDDPVVVLSDDNYSLLLGIYATIYAGGIAVPLDTETSDATIDRVLDVTDSDLVLVDHADLNSSIDADVREIKTELSDGNRYDPPETSPEETTLILFTSGTTGKKKGVRLSHNNLIETSAYINEFMGVTDSITEHILVPVYHSFGFARTRCIFMVKGTAVLDDGQFNPLLALKRMESFDCDAFSGVPSVIAMLIQAGEQRFTEIGSQIDHVEIGSSPMDREDKEFLLSTLPNARICMHYGLTEASRTCFLDFRKDREKLDSVGKPSPGVSVSIVDDSGTELPPGETGEIVISGPNVATGYLEDSVDETESDIGDCFYSGDVGYKDEDGYVYFEGRSDDIINVGGEKVSPLEIEELIEETTAVTDEYAVVGEPDDEGIYSSVPVLCVTDSEFTPQEFTELRSALHNADLQEKFLPRTVYQVTEIPRTQNGKIRRDQISDRLRERERRDIA